MSSMGPATASMLASYSRTYGNSRCVQSVAVAVGGRSWSGGPHLLQSCHTTFMSSNRISSFRPPNCFSPLAAPPPPP